MADEAKDEGDSTGCWALNGACFCGKVTFRVEGPQIFSMYCHCTTCQKLHGAPFVHFLGFPKPNVQVTGGRASIVEVASSKGMNRYSCGVCSARVYNENLSEDSGFIGVPAMALERGADGKIVDMEKIAPTGHIFYDDRVVDMDDDLPKFKAFPGGEVV